jgi:hypothetical protein
MPFASASRVPVRIFSPLAVFAVVALAALAPAAAASGVRSSGSYLASSGSYLASSRPYLASGGSYLASSRPNLASGGSYLVSSRPNLLGNRPNLAKGTAYLVAPGNLIDGHFYESAPRFADFGLTLDGAFALAATGADNRALAAIVSFLDDQGKDPSGRTVNSWTGIGTRYANGGAIGKEALLAEVVGDNPRHFGGHDLITALDASVCGHASASASGPCPAAGSYTGASSVFDQSLGIIAQLRAGQRASAARPIAFLERLRHPDGSFPSLIPDSHDRDVDSTAIAVMALALAPGPAARADVTAGLAWLASQQVASGGFHGVGGLSINSAGLAIQALSLRASRYRRQLKAAEAFLAGEQNADGGFDAYAGQPGPNVRASTQAVSGAVGISFGTLSRELTAHPGTNAPAGSGRPWLPITGAVVLVGLVAGLVLLVRSRHLGRLRSAQASGTPADRMSS